MLFSLPSFQPPSALCSGHSHGLAFFLPPTLPMQLLLQSPRSSLVPVFMAVTVLLTDMFSESPLPRPQALWKQGCANSPHLHSTPTSLQDQKNSWCIVEDRRAGNGRLAGEAADAFPHARCAQMGPSWGGNLAGFASGTPSMVRVREDAKKTVVGPQVWEGGV